jgi:hypothetical protein
MAHKSLPRREADLICRMPRYRRTKRDLHALDENGMVLCNPRDKEAAHRAEMEGIATDDAVAVTCPECLSLLFSRQTARIERRRRC